MYDRPTAAELIDAARHHLEENIVPAVRADHKLYFQTLVAINVLRIVERELQLSGDHRLEEWARLNAIQGSTPRPHTHFELNAALEERTIQLCADIRAGKFDQDAELFEQLKARTIEQLEVANPKFLAALAKEDESRRAS